MNTNILPDSLYSVATLADQYPHSQLHSDQTCNHGNDFNEAAVKTNKIQRTPQALVILIPNKSSHTQIFSRVADDTLSKTAVNFRSVVADSFLLEPRALTLSACRTQAYENTRSISRIDLCQTRSTRCSRRGRLSFSPPLLPCCGVRSSSCLIFRSTGSSSFWEGAKLLASTSTQCVHVLTLCCVCAGFGVEEW